MVSKSRASTSPDADDPGDDALMLSIGWLALQLEERFGRLGPKRPVPNILQTLTQIHQKLPRNGNPIVRWISGFKSSRPTGRNSRLTTCSIFPCMTCRVLMSIHRQRKVYPQAHELIWGNPAQTDQYARSAYPMERSVLREVDMTRGTT